MVAVAQLVSASDCGSEGLRVRSPSATPEYPYPRIMGEFEGLFIGYSIYRSMHEGK